MKSIHSRGLWRNLQLAIPILIVIAVVLIFPSGCSDTDSGTQSMNKSASAPVLPLLEHKSFSDLDAALKAVEMPVQLPEDTLGCEFEEATVNTGQVERGISITYGRELGYSSMKANPELPTFQERVQGIIETYTKTLTPPEDLDQTKLPYLLDVAGHKAMMWPTSQESLSLYWLDSGLEYQVSVSGILASEENVLRVANSVYR